MDGLLIDSEDKYSMITNEVLQMYGKPNLPWSVKAQLQGRPQPEVYISPVICSYLGHNGNSPTGEQNLPRLGETAYYSRGDCC